MGFCKAHVSVCTGEAGEGVFLPHYAQLSPAIDFYSNSRWDCKFHLADVTGWSSSDFFYLLLFGFRKFGLHLPLFESLLLQHGNIRQMHAFILKHRKDYTDTYRSTEKDRDNIEHEVLLFSIRTRFCEIVFGIAILASLPDVISSCSQKIVGLVSSLLGWLTFCWILFRVFYV